MTTCTACQTSNAEGSLLCSRCGTSLTADATAASAPSALAGGVSAAAASHPISSMTPAMDVQRRPEGSLYRPSGRLEAAGIPLMLLGGVLGALVIGVLYGTVSRYFNIPVLFPLLFGLFVGGIVHRSAVAGKVRNVALAGAIAFLAGVLCFGAMHGTRAWSVRSAMIEEAASISLSKFAQSGAQLTPQQQAQMRTLLRQTIEQNLTPLVTLRIYFRSAAEHGRSIGRAGRSGINFSGNAYWGLLAVELLVMALASTSLGVSAAQKPFCEECGQWHEEKEVLHVHPVQNEALVQKVNDRDWQGLMETEVGEVMDGKNRSTVKVSRCTRCGCGTLMLVSTAGLKGFAGRQHLAPESVRALTAAS